MKKPTPDVIPMFTEDDLQQVKASGSAWMNNPDDPATVPVPLQIIMVNVEGPYTERDRKLWTFLLHAVWDELEAVPLHELSVSEINRVFRELGGEHGSEWIWESAKRLAKTTVEWEYTLGDERVLGVSSLFGAMVSKPARQTGRLKFHFPPLLIPIIKQPHRFARLRVHFMMGLSGKYAVTLYELLEGFSNRRDGLLECSLSDFRQWMKVPEGTYPTWKNFKLRVLDPAIDQINADPLGAGLSVAYEPLRSGRFYDRLRFKIIKSQSRAGADAKIKRKLAVAKAIETGKAKDRPLLLSASIDKARKATGYYLDMDAVEQEFWTHWETTGRPDFTRNVEAAFIGFAKKKLRQVRAEEHGTGD